uniref:Uncharacterized protein n=1 Tax=Romanomermis culicivorax TaxID=13658 RepID=A0A915JGJ6_ROMCU
MLEFNSTIELGSRFSHFNIGTSKERINGYTIFVDRFGDETPSSSDDKNSSSSWSGSSFLFDNFLTPPTCSVADFLDTEDFCIFSNDDSSSSLTIKCCDSESSFFDDEVAAAATTVDLGWHKSKVDANLVYFFNRASASAPVDPGWKINLGPSTFTKLPPGGETLRHVAGSSTIVLNESECLW